MINPIGFLGGGGAAAAAATDFNDDADDERDDDERADDERADDDEPLLRANNPLPFDFFWVPGFERENVFESHPLKPTLGLPDGIAAADFEDADDDDEPLLFEFFLVPGFERENLFESHPLKPTLGIPDGIAAADFEDADDDDEPLLRDNNPLPLPFGFFLVPGNLLLNQFANFPLGGLAGPATAIAPGFEDKLDFFFFVNIDKKPLLRRIIAGAATAPLGSGIAAGAAATGPPLGSAAATFALFGGGTGSAAATFALFGGGTGAKPANPAPGPADDEPEEDEPEDDDVAADECGDGTTDGGNEATHTGLSAAAATAAAAAAAAAAFPALGSGWGAAAAFPALGSGTGAAAAFAAAAATDVTVFDGSMPAFSRRFFDSCCSFSFFHSLYFFLVLSPIYLAPSTPFFPRYAVPAAPLFMRCAVAFLVLGAI